MTVDNKVVDKLNTSTSLPQLPQVLLKLINALDDQDTTIDDLTGIISADPSLSSRLMQIIGSAAVNLPKDINSIETAVVYLGMDTIKNIAISSSALHIFNAEKPISEFNINQFWFHSYKCGLVAKKIAMETEFPNPEEAFLAGLLHDIGRMTMVLHYPEEYGAILGSTTFETDILDAEKKAFNTTSPQVSAWIFRRWGLSSLTADAVLYLNEGLEEIANALSLVKILYSAHALSQMDQTSDTAQLTTILGIDPSRLEELVIDADIEVAGMAEILGISIITTDSENLDAPPADDIHEHELALRLQDMTLFYGTFQNLFQSEDQASVLTITDTGLKLLFGMDRIFYFLHDKEKKFLTGFCHANDKHHNIISSIAIPWSNTTSILTRSLSTNTLTTSFDADASEKSAICDTQIIRLLETEGMVSVPMKTGGKPIGIIVLGVNKNHMDDLKKKKALLDLFARQTALCIQNIRYRNEYAVILQNERMQAFSTISRKIIHEVNNPIVIIINYLKMLSLKLPDKHPVQSELVVINEEINRISKLIQGLSGFSKPEIRDFRPVNINQLYASVLEVIKKSLLLPRGISAVLNADPNVPVIKTDKNGLKQVFINLLKNASEAMPDGGDITITTRYIQQSAKIMIDEKKRLPGTIEIIIADNGPGIPGPIMEKLFEPYNSSKNENNSGLGLSIVHSIMKLLNGTITCRSNETTGTTFTLLLPVLSTRKKHRPIAQ